MRDIKLNLLDSEDKVNITAGDEIEELTSPSQLLIQKIIIALNQEANSNYFTPEGYSLKFLLNKKVTDNAQTELRMSVFFLLNNLQKSIIAEQEKLYGDDISLTHLLEKIELLDVVRNGDVWEIHINIFDKAGGKVYMRI
jgi:hypothetical protein